MGDAVWAVVVAVKVEIFTRYVVAKVGVDDPDQQQQRRKRKRRRDDLFCAWSSFAPTVITGR